MKTQKSIILTVVMILIHLHFGYTTSTQPNKKAIMLVLNATNHKQTKAPANAGALTLKNFFNFKFNGASKTTTSTYTNTADFMNCGLGYIIYFCGFSYG